MLQYGRFDERSTQMVSWALLWYAAGLVGHCMVEILARAFYALHNTKTPVIVGVAAMGLNVALSVLFAALFQRLGWMPHGGLALANSLATALEATTLFIVMQKRLNGIEGKHILRGVVPSLVAMVGMSALIYGWLTFGQNLSAWILVPIGVAAGGAVYLAALWILRVPELQYLLNGVLRRIKKRLPNS